MDFMPPVAVWVEFSLLSLEMTMEFWVTLYFGVKYIFAFWWSVCSFTTWRICCIISILTNSRSRTHEFSLSSKKKAKSKNLHWQEEIPGALILGRLNNDILIGSCKLFLFSPLYPWLVNASWYTENRLDFDEHCSERFQSSASTAYVEFTGESLKE